MTISKYIITHIENRLSMRIDSYESVSGGSINDTYCLQTSHGKYFIKINSKNQYPGMFSAEAAGLATIMQTETISVPQVVLKGDIDDESFLMLEWIDTRRPTANGFEQLGIQLARMHQCEGTYFGFEHDNYMGSLPQSNKKQDTWTAFFINERLLPMVKMAADKKLLNAGDIAGFEKLYQKLPELFDEEAASLIHGDLWGGNYLISDDEKPYLIDPAISYGHREFDIAMTTLFGGFSNEFYQAYHECFPLAKGWEQRLDLWNLYPVLVHLNLFGLGYLQQVRGCLKQYL